MDQMVIPGEARQLNYYVGRKYAKGATSTDRYLSESTALRNAYQLEVGAASVDAGGNYTFGATAEDFINSLGYYGVDKTDLRNILSDDFKPADFKIDLDKFINYGEYYWLPNGPQAVLLDFSKDNELFTKLSALHTGNDTYFDTGSFYVTSDNHPTRLPANPVDAFPNTLVGRTIADTLLSFRIPLSPISVQTQNQVSVPPASMFGVAVDGQPFYTYNMGSKEQLGGKTYTINTPFLENHSVTFTSTEINTPTSFDRNEDEQHVSPTPFNGHPDINGVLHYHAFTAALNDSTDLSPVNLVHSKILGYAFDGFPIYGPKGYVNADGSGGVMRVTSSYRLKAATADRGTPDGRYVEDFEYVPGLGMLDANNGRYTITPEFPNGTYAYFLTTDSTGTIPTFPYVAGPKWTGTPIQQSGTIQVPAAATLFNGVPSVDVDKDIIGKDRFIYGAMTFMNGLKIKFNNTASPSFYRNKEFYVEGVGKSIRLIPLLELVPNMLETPTLYVQNDDTYDSAAYDTNEYDGIEYAVLDKHYITINRASQDRNAWSRSNRWFHYRVLEQTATLLGSPFTVDNQLKATRPIIEFNANLALFNHARTASDGGIVDLIDFNMTDALSQVQGGRGYIADQVQLADGMKVVFAADTDPAVRSTIFDVNVVNLAQNRITTQDVLVPGISDPPNNGPYEWLYDSASFFSLHGDFRFRTLEVTRTDPVTTATTTLIPNVDFSSTIVYNPQAILNIVVIDGGGGYSTVPDVIITGDGTGATAVAVMEDINGIIKDIVITNPGSGYTYANVTIPATFDPGGSQALARVNTIGPEERATITLNIPNPNAAIYTVAAYDYEPTIALTPATTATNYSGIWASNGVLNKGKAFYLKNNSWVPAQNKTAITQAPLFDLVDANHNSIGDRTVYTGSTFLGTKLFSYKVGTGTNDSVLGFPLSYKAIGLTGDIQFNWNHSTDTFAITSKTSTATLYCESFYALDTSADELRAVTQSTSRLSTLPVTELRYIDAATTTIDLKVSAIDSDVQHTILVELNDKILYQGMDFDLIDRVYSVNGNTFTKPNARLLFRQPLKINDKLFITQWTTDDTSKTDLVWRLPLSLTINPANDQIQTMTYSDMTAHLVSGAQLLKTLVGAPLDDNNLADEPTISQLCNKFGYHNGNTLMAMALLKNRSMGFVQSLEYARDEYTKFKNTIIQQFDFASFDDSNPIPSMFDNLISNYVTGKTDTFPFYNSDMIPGFTHFSAKSYVVRYAEDKTYPLSAVWSNLETSRKAVLVYHNSTILTRFKDYDFDATSSLTIKPTYPLQIGDSVTIREYDTTTENWIATTPTKLGLSAIYQPGLVVLPHPSGDVTAIQGHDGSLTPAFGDQRDSLLLELENRIYNNIKQGNSTLSDTVLNAFDPLPGKYRSADIDLDNATNILDRAFGQWILKSHLPYTVNTAYSAADPWTWNYRGQTDIYGNTVKQGNWFGIYRYYFDTEYPHMEPWKMVGFTSQPTWWEGEYGPAPYTNQNAKLWDDMERGLIRQGARAGIDSRYIRTVVGSTVKLSSIIPVDSHGALVPPQLAGLVRITNANTLDYDWIFGDAGPVEQAWIRSSEYTFAIQAYLALIDARYYFGSAFDLLDTKIDSVSGSLQRIYDTTITTLGKVIRQTDVATSFSSGESFGYFTWIEARAKALNINTTDFLSFIDGIVPRLMFRMTGYTDKDKLNVYVNSVTPGSKNAASLLPDDNYQLLLDQSSPTSNLVYSGVTVTKTQTGWRVEGYDTERTYFLTLPSLHNGPKTPVRVGDKLADFMNWSSGQQYVKGQIVKHSSTFYKVLRDHTSDTTFTANTQTYAALRELPIQGGITATLWTTYGDTPTKVYYGTVFESAQEVFDFLQAYGKYLENQGFLFDQYDSTLGEIKNWLLSGKEFLYWTLQNWNVGSAITLSPASQLIQIYIPQGDMDPLYGVYADPDGIVDQNGTPLVSTDIAVDRNFDVVTVTPVNADKNIFLLKAVISDFDHLTVFDQISDFNDVIYDPTTGARQERLTIKGSKSNGWNGKLFAPGFTVDLADVQDWLPYTDYTVGDLVKVGTVTYAAKENHNSDTLFDYSKWTTLIKQPYKHLQLNLDSLATRMEKFYDLNSEQIASDVSSYARHLIAFQPRAYLDDLLVNDETQFKFYQGMITQKGTSAAVDKLSRGANPGGIPVVDIKDEWGLRVGEFGLSDNTDDINIALTTDNLQFDKVLLDLTNSVSYDHNIVPVTRDMLLDYGELTPPAFFPTKNAAFEQKTAGYARLGQVDAAVLTHAQLATVNSDLMNKSGSILWVAQSPATKSAIYRTSHTGPYSITVLDNGVLQLDTALILQPGENVWFSFVTQPSASLTNIEGYQTVSVVTSSTLFTLESQTSLVVGDIGTAFITRFVPIEFTDFDTCLVDNITNVTKTVPAQLTLQNVHNFVGGERVFIDQVDGMTQLNGGIYYAKVVNVKTISLYNDAALTSPVNSQPYTDYVGNGTLYSCDMGVSPRLYSLPTGQRVWIDSYAGGWAVLQKEIGWVDGTTNIKPNPAELNLVNSFGEYHYSWQFSPGLVWLAIRAEFDPIVGNTDQAVFIYQRNTTGTPLTYLEYIRGATPHLTDSSGFGTSIVHLDPATLLISAPLDSTVQTDGGAIQIWERSSGNAWKLETTIRAPTPTLSEKFGQSLLRVDDNLAIIGAPGTGSIYSITRSSVTSTIASITRGASTSVQTVAPHGLSDGQYLTLTDIKGTVELNDRSFWILVTSPTTFTLYNDQALLFPVNSSTYLPYISDGTVTVPRFYQVALASTGISAPDQGIVMAKSGNAVAIMDTNGYGDVAVYTIDGFAAFTPVNTISGTAAVPIDATSRLAISQTSDSIHVAISSPAHASVGVVRVYEVSNITGVTLHQAILPKTQLGSNTFGNSLVFTDNNVLLVGNSVATELVATTLDVTNINGVTTFDASETAFHDPISNFGVVESYGWYDGRYVWDGSIVTPTGEKGSGFGTYISQSNNHIFVTERDISTVNHLPIYNSDTPPTIVWKVDEFVFTNAGWVVESQEVPVVDIALVNRALDYDPNSDRIVNFLNTWDPVKNRHEGNVYVNVDAESSSDPAQYQQDSPGNTYWAAERVGFTWWDSTNSVWLWYEQGDLSYRLKNWGQLFPGADIVVSEWIESTVTPASYNAGNSLPELGYPPLGASQPYNTVVTVDSSGASTYKYYYWVANKSTIAQGSNKTMSAAEIRAGLISGPAKWATPSGPSSIITNGLRDDLTNGEEVLQLEVLRRVQDQPRHLEWVFLSEGDNVAPPPTLVNKMIDSIVGTDTANNLVPDVTLTPYKRIGVHIRPRQSMFIDHITAIQTSTEFLNEQLAKLIIGDELLGDLTSIDVQPLASETQDVVFESGDTTFDDGTTVFNGTITNWNVQVATYVDISQSNQLLSYPVGYKILVLKDENHDNYWSIYTWDGTELVLSMIQHYDTTQYWSRVDYYSADYPAGSIPDVTLNTEQEFLDGDYVGQKVKVLGPNYWRVLIKDSTGDSTILAMQNGTITINLTASDFINKLSWDSANFDSTLFDPIPTIELRNILNAMQNSIFAGQNLPVWNSWFFRMVRYALTEQKQLDWAFKSSFIKVTNTIASLTQRPLYSLDVQDSLQNYITEVKPYHTKIREYIAAYTGTDTFQNLSTDFDAPPYYGASVDVNDPEQAPLFESGWPYRAYRDGRGYDIVAIVVTSGGSGYVSEPTVSFVGGTRLQTTTVSPKATAIVGVAPQNFSSLGDNNYFTFRKAWLDQQAVKDPTISTNDLSVPGQTLGLLAGMAGTNAYSVKRIVVDNVGGGYLTPPDIVITGGGGTGATAYAVLGDAQARMIRTGLKFDRVKGVPDILYSDIRNPALDNPSFDEWHAADRIAAFYKPVAGQPGIPVRTTLTYTGDGVTTTYSLPQDFRYEELLQVALDDQKYDSSTYTVFESDNTIEFAVAPPLGAVITLALNPPLLGLMQGADFDKTKTVGPKFDDGPGFSNQERGFDGSPYDDWEIDPTGGLIAAGSIDTYQQSGLFATALGYDPTAAVTTDGTDFLSPDVIPNTEELVTGQMFDTLDMRVFSNDGGNYTGFRIFKDMTGETQYYRITTDTTTQTTIAVVGPYDNIIPLVSTVGLHIPDRTTNDPGIVMIDGERIEYWTMDATSISDLRRGTGGTAGATHAVGAYVTSISSENLIPACDIDRVATYTTDGSTTLFDLPVDLAPTTDVSTIRVYLGGKRIYDGYSILAIDPTLLPSYYAISFVTAPKTGLELKIVVKQSETWYNLASPNTLRNTSTLWADFMNDSPAPAGMAV